MKHFTRETLEVDEVDDKVQFTTFKAGLKCREFMVALATSDDGRNAPKSLEVHECQRCLGSNWRQRDTQGGRKEKEKIEGGEKGREETVTMQTGTCGKMTESLRR